MLAMFEYVVFYSDYYVVYIQSIIITILNMYVYELI